MGPDRINGEAEVVPNEAGHPAPVHLLPQPLRDDGEEALVA